MLNRKMHNKPLVYLDSAATAQKPQVVIDALDQFYRNDYGRYTAQSMSYP